MRPLNSTLAGRVLIRLTILWGGAILLGWLFWGTPLQHTPPPVQAILAPILLFGIWISAIVLGAKPKDES